MVKRENWIDTLTPGGKQLESGAIPVSRNHPARAASLPLEAPQGVQSHEPDRPTGVEFYFEQVGGTQV